MKKHKSKKFRWLYITGSVLLSLIIAFLLISAQSFPAFEALQEESEDLIWLQSQPIAHRGYHDDKNIPENSLAAFCEAIKKGYAIELDVILTKDNELAVIHDFNTKRVTGVDMEVPKHTMAQLKELSLLESEEKIPSLQEVLDLVDARVPILLEIKSNGFSTKTSEKTYSAIKEYKGHIAVQSFNSSSIRWFYKNAPEMTRGMLHDGNWPFALLNTFVENMENLYSKPNFIAYKYVNLPNTDFCKLRKDGLILLGWTVPESMLNTREFTAYCDNIILEAVKEAAK